VQRVAELVEHRAHLVVREERGPRRLREASPEQLGRARPRERRPAGEELVEDAARGIDVGAGVDPRSRDLLWRHVGRGAHDQARRRTRPGLGLRSPRLARPEHWASEAEVEDLEPAVGGQHQVRRLDVAVHDAPGVRRAERIRHLCAEAQDILDRQRTATEPLRERLPLDQLLGDVERRRAARCVSRGLSRLIDGGDPGVVEGRGRPGLAQEALARRDVGRVLRPHELQRDLAPQHAVPRPVDDAHAPGAEAFDQVEVSDGARLHDSLRSFRRRTGEA